MTKIMFGHEMKFLLLLLGEDLKDMEILYTYHVPSGFLISWENFFVYFKFSFFVWKTQEQQKSYLLTLVKKI